MRKRNRRRARERMHELEQGGERNGVFARGRVIGGHLRKIARLESRLALLEIGRGAVWLAAVAAAFAVAAVFVFFMLALLVGAALALATARAHLSQLVSDQRAGGAGSQDDDSHRYPPIMPRSSYV